MKDAIEAGLNWLATRWDKDKLADYAAMGAAGTPASFSKPANRDYDLHFNIPGAVEMLEVRDGRACNLCCCCVSKRGRQWFMSI